MVDADELRRQIERTRRRQMARLAAEYGPVADRLRASYDRALTRIEADIERALMNNPRATVGTAEALAEAIREQLRPLAAGIEGELRGLQTGAANAGVDAGVAAMRGGGMAVEFGRPLLEAIAAAIDYLDSPAMQTRLAQLAGYHAQQALDIMLAAIATGTNPRDTARLLREYFVNSARPYVDAERWARTLQMYSYRQGTREVYERNGVTHWRWSANLGNPRTCVGCIAMHGTRHPVTQVLNDHHNGRCAMVPETPSWSEFGADGTDVIMESGVDWMRRQPEDVQRQVMGPKMFDAWRGGLIDFTPEVIVTTYDNDVFGEMRRPRSVDEMLRIS